MTLPDHVHGLIFLDRQPRRVEFTKALLRFHASFDRVMILPRMLFTYWASRWRQQRRKSPSFFTPEIAEPFGDLFNRVALFRHLPTRFPLARSCIAADLKLTRKSLIVFTRLRCRIGRYWSRKMVEFHA